MSLKINSLSKKAGQNSSKGNQLILPRTIEREREIEGIVMGVLSDGTPYLNQRGLDAIVDKVLAYRPKPKTKPAKKRQRASKRIQKERL